ncbi:MAG: hypothetical protein ACPGN3_13795 [Opitutales bacterium]
MHSPKLFGKSATIALSTTAFSLFTACSSDVSVEIVDKPIDFTTTAAASPQPASAQTNIRSGAADLRWTIPADWETTAPPRMVMARFTAPSSATLSISNFSGGGSDIANLTRWAGQLGIPFDASQVDSFRRPASARGLRLDRYYMASDSKAFDVTITRLHGTAWFFKLEGSIAAVDEARAGYESFLSSLLHFHGPHDQSPAPTVAEVPEKRINVPPPAPEGTPGPVNPSSSMQALPGMEQQVAGISEASWSAPDTWTVGPQRAMRKGTYLLNGEAGQAELSITAFPGDVGGLAANINRWRGQIGLEPLAEAALREQSMSKDIGGYASHIVWLQGDNSSILGAIVPRSNDTWFFKAIGPAATLEEHRQAFADFLETVSF